MMNEQIKLEEKKIFHIGFEIALLIKGINGLLEIIGGILLFFITPERLNRFIIFVTKGELGKDPNDVIANWFIQLGNNFSISSQYFGIYYLMSHGIIKLVIITLLWRKKLWAYPLSVVVFIAFIAYQIYEYTISGSIFMILLTILDIIVIALTIIEYRSIKAKNEGDKVEDK